MTAVAGLGMQASPVAGLISRPSPWIGPAQGPPVQNPWIGPAVGPGGNPIGDPHPVPGVVPPAPIGAPGIPFDIHRFWGGPVSGGVPQFGPGVEQHPVLGPLSRAWRAGVVSHPEMVGALQHLGMMPST